MTASSSDLLKYISVQLAAEATQLTSGMTAEQFAERLIYDDVKSLPNEGVWDIG